MTGVLLADDRYTEVEQPEALPQECIGLTISPQLTFGRVDRLSHLIVGLPSKEQFPELLNAFYQ